LNKDIVDPCVDTGDTLDLSFRGEKGIAMLRTYGGVRTLLALVFAFCLPLAGSASAASAPTTVPVVMLSDIHFDPFHDPSKLAALRDAPVTAWAALLSEPAPATQPDAFASLQKTCDAKGVDTDWALLASSLKAAAGVPGHPLFVTMSGDLMAHAFKCRFEILAPSAGPADYAAFAEKTVAFVALQLRLAFPHTPVYIALGNNDSACGDYQETPDSGFLREVAKAVAADAPADDRASVLRLFSDEGDYTVPLPKPMRQTRLIVLQDLFQSTRYKTCSGAADPAAAKTQMAWLTQQLAEARGAGEHVWVMTHIPPGVDAYSTFHHGSGNNVCSGEAPSMFLGSDGIAETLAQYGDTVRMVILAHTHNDEMRLLPASGGEAIPAKLVPSISPVHGNNPAFMVAEVNPHTATLIDYSVYAASSQGGLGTQWPIEYRYSAAYGLPDFSGVSVRRLIADFSVGGSGEAAKARAYQGFYSAGTAGKQGSELPRIWQGYVCSMTVQTEAAFRSCVCAAKDRRPTHLRN
jgi:sphingomyelin phosphodiesterase acid-like 3